MRIIDGDHVRQSETGFAELVARESGQPIEACYQCGKCSAGCPLATEMDYSPNQVLRMLQLEMAEFDAKVLGSLSIWLCLTCQTCMACCPKEVDLPRVMDFLREQSLRRGKCGRCNVEKTYVCKDGPVFTFEQVKELPPEY